jgi:ammonia channel protein AmtB
MIKFIQVGYQTLASTAAAAWSFMMTIIILNLINLIPFCKVRVSEKAEAQ